MTRFTFRASDLMQYKDLLTLRAHAERSGDMTHDDIETINNLIEDMEFDAKETVEEVED